MKIDDIAILMGKTKEEIKEILENNDVIEIKLTEKKSNPREKEKGQLEVID